MDDYITKPFGSRELIDLMAKFSGVTQEDKIRL
jgi:DNA-binding response OmpR family regulator